MDGWGDVNVENVSNLAHLQCAVSRRCSDNDSIIAGKFQFVDSVVQADFAFDVIFENLWVALWYAIRDN